MRRSVHSVRTVCAAPLPRSAPKLARHYSRQGDPFEAKEFKYRHGKGKERALVLMFGWLGAKGKYLKKYSECYGEHEFSTVSYTPALTSVYDFACLSLFPDASQKRGDDMALALRDFSVRNPSTKIIFHTFSGNGLHFYGQVQKGLRQHNISLPNVSGIILDSPPYKITPEQFVSGFAGAVEVPGFVRPLNTAVWRAFFALFLSKARLQRFKEMEHELIHHPPPIPQLLLYSDADTVTPANGLPEYLAIQRARNLNVRAVNFHTSGHVQHMRYFPELYWKEVSNFIELCTKEPQNQKGA